MIEMCMTLLLLSMLSAFFLPIVEWNNTDYYKFADDYLLKQSQAMCEGTYGEFHSDNGESVVFNDKGNVLSARTISFSGRKEQIVVELGGGRLVFKE